ncbi:hypothetical protein GCM10009583_25330 [Ornithinicoccus hortensis]
MVLRVCGAVACRRHFVGQAAGVTTPLAGQSGRTHHLSHPGRVLRGIGREVQGRASDRLSSITDGGRVGYTKERNPPVMAGSADNID